MTAPGPIGGLVLAVRALAARPGMLVFGQDVARKGGVYGVTRGLLAKFGAGRVFDTLLDEQSILGLALVRFANRLRVRRRLPPSTNAAGTPAYLVEKTVHHLLYVLMFAIPLLGWLKTNAAGHVTNCFGLFSLPTLVPKSHEPLGPTRALRPAQ